MTNTRKPKYRLYLVGGLPGAGKTELCKALSVALKPAHTIDISQRRLQLAGSKADFTLDSHVYAGIKEDVAYQLFRSNVLVEGVFCRPWSRDRLFTGQRDYWKKDSVFIWVDTPFSECCHRNNTRPDEDRVPHSAMVDMHEKVQIMTHQLGNFHTFVKADGTKPFAEFAEFMAQSI